MLTPNHSQAFRWAGLCTLLFLLVCGLPLRGQMVASNDRVRVEGQLSTDTDHKDLKGTSSDTVTQHKTLTIRLSGKAGSPESRVVKWKAYGRNVKSNDLTVLESGQFKLALDSRGQQTATTKKFSSTYTPDHAVTTKNKNRGNNRGGGGNGRDRLPQTKRVEGSGTKFAGYSVQVLDGGKVVGETSDPVGIGSKD